MLNSDLIKQDFPIFKQNMYGKPLIFFDNASSTQKPQCVIDALVQYYSTAYANIHRGVYKLSAQATELYEKARETVQHFIHAKHAHEIIFVKGTTEAINLIAQSYGCANLKQNDEIIITQMEHHSNLVPWQAVCQQLGAHLKVIPVTDKGELDLVFYEKILSSRTRLVALSHVSNLLGTINPIEQIIKMAHAKGVPVLVDGAQAVAHMPIDVQQLDCDFYVFSSHKMYGPTGIGILYGKTHLLKAMKPYQYGGGMIEQVSFEKTTYAELPAKFEAGTPPIAGAIALAEAIRYLEKIGLSKIEKHEHALLEYATKALLKLPQVRIIGQATHKAALISFIQAGIHPHDIATALDLEGIAVRAGHHCSMPLVRRFNLPAIVRVSFGLYNSFSEIDHLIEVLKKTAHLFKG